MAACSISGKRIFTIIACLILMGIMGEKASSEPASLRSNQTSNPYPELITDSLFLYSPSLLKFDIQTFLDQLPGPLKHYREVIDGQTWRAAEIVRFNAIRYGINPQVILLLLEAQFQALTNSNAVVPKGLSLEEKEKLNQNQTFFGHIEQSALNLLGAYDAHRFSEAPGNITSSTGETLDVSEAESSGTYAVQNALAEVLPLDQLVLWIQNDTALFLQNFRKWFGDPYADPDPIDPTTAPIPTGYILPFEVDETWYLTGGPHNYAGGIPGCISGPGCPRPWSSVDIAQPEVIGCPVGTYPPDRWVVASKEGTVVQAGNNLVVIDHNDGWRTSYFHLADIIVQPNEMVEPGQRLGHPSCQGGQTTGIHVHFSIWQAGIGYVDIDGSVLSRWKIEETSHYNGRMVRNDVVQVASIGRYEWNAISNNPYDDNFNTNDLSPNWYWVREDPTHWGMFDPPGHLQITTQGKDIWTSINSAPLLLQTLQPFTGDDFEIRTQVSFEPAENYHQAGLIIYEDDDNYVRFTYAYVNGQTFELAKEINGEFQPTQLPAPPGINDFHLRLARIGQDYYGYYSQDGESWIPVGVHRDVNLSPSDTGLFAFHGENEPIPEIPADFDYFQMLDPESLIFLPFVHHLSSQN